MFLIWSMFLFWYISSYSIRSIQFYYIYFQVYLSVQDVSSNSTATSEKIGATLQEISSNFISAFQNIRKISPWVSYNFSNIIQYSNHHVSKALSLIVAYNQEVSKN